MLRPAIIACIAVAGFAGCHRAHYRQQADVEAAGLIREKIADPRWCIDNYQVYPDARSRFAEPHCSDHPPKPCDDPMAECLSPDPQPEDCCTGPYEGTEYLHLLPIVDEISLSEVADELDPLAPEGEPFRMLGPNNAYEVGLLNSRQYQDRRESMYLAALDLSLERFAFGPQFFATQRLMYEHIGRLLPGGDPATGRPSGLSLTPGDLSGNVVTPGESPNSVALNGQSVDSFTGLGPFSGTGFGVGKLFVTGGALLLQFANDTVFELSGPFEGTFSQSNASLQLLQPLLRGGGRAVTLEPLTQTERNLLYEVRSFARFQREFYTSVATGDRLTQGARLDASQESDEDEDGVRSRVGLLPLIEQLQILRNEVRNLEYLETHLKRFEALQKAEEVSNIQLDQVSQDVAQARARVIRIRRRYFANLDRFKIQLGVPTNLPLVLDPQLLEQFQLDPENCTLEDLPDVLQEIEFSAAEVEGIAIENRLDLMNARASVVDYWRKVRVSANGLMGVLDVEYEGSMLSPDPNVTSKPFDFSGNRSSHRIKLNGELPLVRIRERNIYRATLIEYQRARRNLMLAEDTVRLEVRNSLREFQAAKETFEIQYEAVVLACRRVDQTRRLLQMPPRPGETRELGTNSARNLLESQQDLVDAQNDLVESWVDYLTSRVKLERDMGILEAGDANLTQFGDQRTAMPEESTPIIIDGSIAPPLPFETQF